MTCEAQQHNSELVDWDALQSGTTLLAAAGAEEIETSWQAAGDWESSFEWARGCKSTF